MIGNMQFAAIVVLTLLTLELAFMLSLRGKMDSVPNRSRWMMAAGTALLAAQFLLQYVLGLRQMGVTQAVMLNLLMFIPSSWLLTLSVLYLQRQGRLKWHEWYAGGIMWAVVTLLIVMASVGDGQPFFCDTPAMRRVEWIGAGLYAALQSNYTYMLLVGLRQVNRTLENYYDRDQAILLRWMTVGTWVLAAIAIFVPVVIFLPGWPLMLFAMLVLAGVYYLVHSFCDYVISKNALRVMTAQRNATEAGMDDDDTKTPAISDEERRRVDALVAQWTATGAYLRNGITMPAVAAEMHITQLLLRAWYHAAGYESYPDWMQRLRIDHAKTLMREHPDWSLESIAEQSGFNSRNYFHKVFLKATGMTPAQYLKS